MLAALTAILAGVLLLADMFHGKGQDFINALRPYEVVIGVVAIVVGALHLVSLLGIALILAGLILGVGALQTIPRVGDDLARASRSLSQFRMLVGIVVLVLGVLALF